ncbi:hypothetical protein LPY66_07670 [Dehalobacter sp. DCM]|uniref:hypothetical protein n=1 Tax=Dehalobacter sp. DCM TaxID=2907827 RepID=UPI0030821B86|nr:hypothetical protein LPY66_07670 [Dehalobacter sp. DCM]
MKTLWKKVWDAHPSIFAVSGLEECTDETRKGWHLPAQFAYFSGGDINLRIGIIAAEDKYKDEDFLLGGIQWGAHIGNGTRTVIYFVAADFSPVFVKAINQIGGMLVAKAVFWKARLTPSLYAVTDKDYYKASFHADIGEPRCGLDYWHRELNAVAWNHLRIINDFFDGLTRRRVRTVYEKNKIVYCWGNIEIAEVKKKGNKFDLATKVKWTRNKNIASKFSKLGWVDVSGNINDEFCRSITGILELLENMEINGSLDTRDLFDLKVINDKEAIPRYFGRYLDSPWLPRDRNDMIDMNHLYFFQDGEVLSMLKPVLEKPFHMAAYALLAFSAFESSIKDNKTVNGIVRVWNEKIFFLCEQSYLEELLLFQSWLKQPEKFPIYILPKEWKTEGFKGLKELSANAFVY